MPKYVNAPGRFDRKPRLVAKDAAHLAGLTGVVAVGFTEMANSERAAALVVDGWTLHHHGGVGVGECAILTKDAHFPTIHASTAVQLTDGGGRARLKHPLYARVVVAETQHGHVQVLTECHLPAHLEGLWAAVPMSSRLRVKRLMRSGSPRVRIWLAAVAEWRRQVHDLAAEYHADDIVVMGDWNLNGHRKWVRQVARRVWPGMGLAVPKGADLGARRAVGWVLTTMDAASVRTVVQASSDHKADVFDLSHVNAAPVKRTAPLTPPDPFERCTYNGALMDQKTKTFIQTLERDLGYSLTILQGCYNPGGVSASAGTHDGGGVVDLAPFDWQRKVHAARKRGGFYWHRLPIPGLWGEHIHGGIRNHGRLSPAAAAQQRDYDGNPPLDGLADHARDNTWHPDPPVGFDYAAAWKALQKPPAKKASAK